MRKKYSYTKKVNLPPGTLIYNGNRIVEDPEVSIIRYSPDTYKKRLIDTQLEIDEVEKYQEKNEIHWLNVKGISNPVLIEKIGSIFNLHPLLLEDILSPSQRPKFEEYDNYVFLIIKKIEWNKNEFDINTEQVSLVLSPPSLITFQEQKDNLFLSIEQRIEKSKGKIKNSDSSYLLYAIMDSVIDGYFISLEQIGEEIDEIEEKISESPNSALVRKIHSLKHTMSVFKKSVWPLREAINYLVRTDNAIISSTNSLYYRDIIDHLYQVLDTVENYREFLSSLLDLYLTMIGNKTNEIMKVLTIISTIFIPLTFIAGIYGMNFDFMPELLSPWGYPIVWIIMILITIGLLVYFRRKKWI
ncbi:MAG: magnesium/cobalt transporter CorA [Promethearchaeota archaeon]|nr:MAG: magnesium/cobalt transporter CorA [Candidatus Lokiarchaeota archaeon]